MNKELIFAAAVGLAIVAGPTLANADNDKAVSVSMKGLDRNSAADMAVLYDRIVDAAGDACAVQPVTGTRIPSTKGLDACMKTAIANTVDAVDSRELRSIHKAQLAQNKGREKVAIR